MIETLYFRYQNPHFQNITKESHRFSLVNFLLPQNAVTGKRQLHLMPLKVEKFLGNCHFHLDALSFRASLATTIYGLSYQEMADAVLSQLKPMVPKQARRAWDFKVTVIQSDDSNASAYPGGNIVISDQLMRDIYSVGLSGKYREIIASGDDNSCVARVDVSNVKPEDMIAAVIGHEMTHICARHSSVMSTIHIIASVILLIFSLILKLAINYFSAMRKKVIDGDNGSTSSDVEELRRQNRNGQQLVNHPLMRQRDEERDFDAEAVAKRVKLIENLTCIVQPFFHYCNEIFKRMTSRQFEFDCDKYGMIYSARANYDPLGAIVLQKMLSSKDLTPKSMCYLMSWFSTHPTYDRRIDHLVRIIMNHSEKSSIDHNYPKNQVYRGDEPSQSDGAARSDVPASAPLWPYS